MPDAGGQEPGRQTEVETAPETSEPKARHYGRRQRTFKIRYLFIAAVVIAAIIFGGFEIHRRMTHVSEEDARVTADVVTMSSRAEGWLVSVDVDEGDRVKAGQALATLDDRTARLEAEALRARIDAKAATRAALRSQQSMVENQTTTKVGARASGIQAFTAKRNSLRAERNLARQDLERMQALFDRNVVSRARLDQARSEVSRLENAVHVAEAEMAESRGEMAVAEADRGEIGMLDQEVERVAAEEAELRAMLKQQQIAIDDRVVRAPIDGIIDRVFVEAGEYVDSGQRLLLMHDPSAVWVEANIKETEVSRLKIGQPVEVSVDAFSAQNFTGRVDRIGSSTTAKFALLPTPNPSGNFTKITQRVPVKIVFDEAAAPLSPGMMVEVEVDVRE